MSFIKKIILGNGFDMLNNPIKITKDEFTRLAWQNIIRCNTLEEAYKLVIEEMVK